MIGERVALTATAVVEVMVWTAIVFGRVIFDILHQHLVSGGVRVGTVVKTNMIRVVLTVHVFVTVRLCANHGRCHLTTGTTGMVNAVLTLVMLVAVVGVQNMGQDTVSQRFVEDTAQTGQSRGG